MDKQNKIIIVTRKEGADFKSAKFSTGLKKVEREIHKIMKGTQVDTSKLSKRYSI